jgi:hypothetical protein
VLELNKEASQFIRSNADMIASEILNAQYGIQKKSKTGHNEAQIEYALKGIKYHIGYLAESISYSKPELFYQYLKWAKTLFASIEVPDRDLAVTLSVTANTLDRVMPENIKNIPEIYLKGGLEFLNDTSIELPYLIDEEKTSVAHAGNTWVIS